MPARARHLWYRVISRRAAAAGAVLRSRAAGRFHADAAAEPTTYAADTLAGAWLEVGARFGGVPVNPAAFCAWRLSTARLKLVDLTRAGERRRLAITEEQLMTDPAPPRCRALAADLRRPDRGCHGIVYPSVRNGPAGLCVALFLERAGSVPVEPLEAEWEEFVRWL